MAVLAEPVPPRTGFVKKIFPAGLLAVSLLFLLLTGGFDLQAQTASSKEYQVKAAFLYNFSQFVDWPPEAFPQAQTPLVIGIIGDDPFGGSLDEISAGEKSMYVLPPQRYHSPGETGRAMSCLSAGRKAGE